MAAEVTNQANDAASFNPLVVAATGNRRRAGEKRRVRPVVADAGDWGLDNINHRGIELLIALGRSRQLGPISEAEQRGRAATCPVLERVEAGELDTLAAPT